MKTNSTAQSSTKKKKSTKKKASAVYTSDFEAPPISISYSQITLEKVKPIMIRTGKLTRVYIEGDEDMELSYSWIELCLVFLGFLYKHNAEDYLNMLLKYKIISPEFNVTAHPTSFIDNVNSVKAYEIADSGLYLETDMQGKYVKKALLGMKTALGMKKDQIRLDIVPMMEKEKTVKPTKVQKTITYTKPTELKEYNLTEAISCAPANAEFESINILGFEVDTLTVDEAAYALLNWLLEMYGTECINKISKLNLDATIGLTKDTNVESKTVMELSGTKYYFYSLGYIKETLVYMARICREAGLAAELVTVKVRV